MKFCMKCMAQYHDSAKICPNCGYQEGSPQTGSGLPVGTEIGTLLNTEPAVKRYLVGCVNGEHSRSLNYIGFDRFLQCKVSIEEYYPNEMVCRSPGGIEVQPRDGSQQSAFRQGRQQFLYEARRLVPYMYRDCMLKIIDIFVTNDTVYVVRKLEDGETVSARVARSAFHEKDAVSYMNSLLNFLSGLHADGLLIGALHPDNLIVSERGCLVITDYSHITKIGQKNERIAKVNNDPYTALEAASGELSPASDVYAAGAVLYKMLTGFDPKLPAERDGTDEEEKFKLQRKQVSEITGNALLNAMRVRVSSYRTPNAADFYKELNGQGETRISARPIPQINKASDSGEWKKRHKIILACAAALVLVVFGFGIYGLAKGGTPFYMLQGNEKTVKVPDVVGESGTIAEQKTIDAGLVPLISRGDYSDVIEAGMIVNQLLEAGKSVEKGTTLEMIMSLGPENVELPDATNLEQSEAEDLLRGAGFTVKVSTEESTIAPGLVIRQSPEPGFCAKGSEVEIVVSIGKKKIPSGEVKLGDYVGKKYDDVEQMLDKKVIYIKKVMQESDKPEGEILAQDIEPGTTVHHGDTITLTVSSGKKKIVIGNYVSRGYESVYAELTELGFNVECKEVENPLYVYHYILKQSVDAGTVTDDPVNMTIVLTVSKGGQVISETNASQSIVTSATTKTTTATTTRKTTTQTLTTATKETTTTTAESAPPPEEDDNTIPNSSLTWSLENGILTISGTGDMPNLNQPQTWPWYERRGEITQVEISAGITSIGTNAFTNCENLEIVRIPATVKIISDLSFNNCGNLKNTSENIYKGVYFGGTKEQWELVKIIGTNYPITTLAIIHCTNGDIEPPPQQQ